MAMGTDDDVIQQTKNLNVENTQYLFVRAIDVLAIYIPVMSYGRNSI